MPTYLDNLGALHRAEDARCAQLLEHNWETADPYHGGQALQAGLGSAPNDLYHPGAIGFHSARPGSRAHGGCPPYYRTEMQHWMIVDAARTVEAFCPTAVTILEVLQDFAIFTGFQYKAIPKKKAKKADADAEAEPDPLVETAQEHIDKWHRAVDWYAWEGEIFKRTERDGETFLITEPDDESGLLGLRSTEPEQLKEPQGGSLSSMGLRMRDGQTFRFGILAEKEDTSVPLKYSVVSQYSDKAQRVTLYDPDEVFHIKINVDRQAKRGVSSFFAGINDFPGVKKLLRALREGATVQAHIAWIKEHAPGVAPSAIGGDAPTIDRLGNPDNPVVYSQPTTIGVPFGTTYAAGPLGMQGKNSALILVLQAALRNLGARFRMPEGLVSGDASNANLASALVAEAPFVRAMERVQWFYRNAYILLHERVLMAKMGDDILDKVEVSVEMPPVVPRKAKEETERNLMLNEGGHLSNQSLAAREDLDFDDEQALIEKSPIEPPSIMLGMETEMPEGEVEDDTAAEGGKSDTPKVKNPKRPKTQKASAVTSPEDN